MKRRIKVGAKALGLAALGAYLLAVVTQLELPTSGFVLLAVVGMYAAWKQPAVAAGGLLFAAGAIGGVAGVMGVGLLAVVAYWWRTSLMSNRGSQSGSPPPLRYGVGRRNLRDVAASVATAAVLAIVLMPVVANSERQPAPNSVLVNVPDFENPLTGSGNARVDAEISVVAERDRVIGGLSESLAADSFTSIIASERSILEAADRQAVSDASDGAPPWWVILATVVLMLAVVIAAMRLRASEPPADRAPPDAADALPRTAAEVVERLEQLGHVVGVDRPENMGIRSYARLLATETGDSRFGALGDAISTQLYDDAGGEAEADQMLWLLEEGALHQE